MESLHCGAAHAEQDRSAAVRTDGQRIQEGMCWMDVTTQIRLLWLGGLAALCGVVLGMVLLIGALPHRREQRRSRLLGSVRRQSPVELSRSDHHTGLRHDVRAESTHHGRHGKPFT
jgi:hypothetical protein